jgi:hypothetical protein
MVKLVDTADLKSAAARRAGSIPARSTTTLFDKYLFFKIKLIKTDTYAIHDRMH